MMRENLQLNRDMMLFRQNVSNSGVAVTALYQKGDIDKLGCNFLSANHT